MGTEVIGIWVKWEELLLGGAVRLHGTRDWNVFPLRCVKLGQERYSRCKAWFDELQKQRVAELSCALELSENSIGFLEWKLETLKAEGGDDCQVDNYSCQTESPTPFQKSGAVASSSKETSKDGLSASSFTRETRTNWSSESQIPIAAPAEEMEAKPEGSLSSGQDKVSSIEKLMGIVYGGQIGSFEEAEGEEKEEEL